MRWKVRIALVVALSSVGFGLVSVAATQTSAGTMPAKPFSQYGPAGARFTVKWSSAPRSGPANLSYTPARTTGVDYWTGTPKDPYGPNGNDETPANAVSDFVDVEHYPSVADASLVFNASRAATASYAKYTPMSRVPGDASARGLERSTINQGQPGAAETEIIQAGAVLFSLGSNNPHGLTSAQAFTNSFSVVITKTGTTAATTTTAPTHTCPSGDQCVQGFEASNLQVQSSLGEIGGTIRLTNTNSRTDGLNFTVTFFATSNVNGTPIGSATGAALSVAPGQTVTETLISTDAVFSQSNFYWQFQVDDVVPGGA